MINRRAFLKKTGAGSLLAVTGAFPLQAFGEPEIAKLTILHTNDVHSRIDPFPMDGGRYQGKGGTLKRARLIEKIRREEEAVLLLDAGDMFQGTPYFNYFKGEIELKLMTEMGYDAGTIGNHDFDAGIESLSEQLQHADFPLLNCNYELKDTPLNGKIKPYKIFEKNGVRIGILGVGIELDGLVPQAWYGDTQYLSPIEKVNYWSQILKHDEKCDYIICLSHLGYRYKEETISDVILAAETEHIDLIIGGHTHTFLDQPEKVRNKKGEVVLINQVGWAGLVLGRLDIYFERNRKGKCSTCKNEFVD